MISSGKLAHRSTLILSRLIVIVGLTLMVSQTSLAADDAKKNSDKKPTSETTPSLKDSLDAPPNRTDNSERYRSLETLARGLFYLETLYYDPSKVEQKDMVANALRGITSNLDPHTVYMPREAFKQLTIDTQGKFGGVGIIVSSENGKLIVISPIEDTPAFIAGIKAGDEIVEIDGTPIKKMKPGEATDKMRGEPSSKIALTIKRGQSTKLLKFNLTREIINVRSVHSSDLGSNILYTRITSFQDNTTEEYKAALDSYLKKHTIDGLVLDLRDNPGGLLEQAVNISDIFIESGVIVSTVGRGSNDIEREFAHKRGTYPYFPMIVLINGGSASASEIVAGALQDHERALILGTVSFGKGSVQTLVSLPDGSGLKITVARYFTPKDRSIQAKGIAPDFVVEQDVDDKKGGAQPKGPNPPDLRKESDLKGHIESGDLSDLAKNSGMLGAADSWPAELHKDHQLLTAYTYLRGWAIFQKKPQTGKELPATTETKPAADSATSGKEVIPSQENTKTPEESPKLELQK